jgi:hypothetical protein
LVAPIAAAALALMVVGCWPRQQVVLGDAHRLPVAGDLVVPVPTDVRAAANDSTQISMRNVSYHVDDDLRLGIRRLRGRIYNVNGGIVVLDNKNELAVDVAAGEIALTPSALSILLNRYVFGFKGSPLKDMVVRAEGDHIVQTGTMHKILDIPFEMTASLTVTDEGWIRIHPTKMDISGLNGLSLLRAVGRTLADLLDLSGGKGVKVEGNDILLDPTASLPPPRINGKITGIRVEGGEIIQSYGLGDTPDPPRLTPPVPAKNYMYFRGGTIRFGKLFMVDTDLLTVDADESDPFDFYFDYYHSQLVAGRHVTMPNYGLVAYLVDFDKLGTKATIVAGAGKH